MSKLIEKIQAEIAEDDDQYPSELIQRINREAVEVESEMVNEARWSLTYRVVYSLTDGSFIEFTYDSPATEMQEGQPYNTTAVEVEPYEVTVTKFREVK